VISPGPGRAARAAGPGQPEQLAVTSPLRITLVPLLGVGLLAACSEYDADIEAVKSLPANNATVAELVEELAGEDGKVLWDAEMDSDYLETQRYVAENSNKPALAAFLAEEGEVIRVRAVIETPLSDLPEVVLLWLRNRETGAVIPMHTIILSSDERRREIFRILESDL